MTTGHRPPEIRCAWVEPAEEPGARYLVPGCYPRVEDPDAPCACPTTARQLATALERLATQERQHARLTDTHYALVAAVGRHPDHRALFEAADQLAADWRRLTHNRPDDEERGLFLVDVDGTIAVRDELAPDMRGPYDWDRVGEDLPHMPVILTVRALAAAGHRIIYVSGRSEECRAATSAWIACHVGVPGEALHMRPAGDHRPDYVVKRELFERWIRPVGPVTAVLDDRVSVVDMWRGDLGLTVLDVAGGKY